MQNIPYVDKYKKNIILTFHPVYIVISKAGTFWFLKHYE